MSFLGRALTGISSLSPSPFDDYWYGPRVQPTTSGVKVDTETALTYSAVWCATRILSEGVAGLPMILYRRTGDNGKERATDQLLYSILHDEPNDETDSFQFFDQCTAWLVNSGNMRCEIQRNQAGTVVALWPIHPSRIRIQDRRQTPGRIVYLIRNDDGTESPIESKDILNVVGTLSDDGICGRGVVPQGRESIGSGIAVDRFAGAFFGNSAVPSGVLTHPGRLKPEAAQNLRSSWNRMYSGPANANKTAILEEGVTYAKIGIDPEQAQFLETRTFNIDEIARWYRVPPHMLYELMKSTNNNIEFQGGEFVTYSLRPWLQRIERAITRQLIPVEMRKEYFVEFLVDALLRGDLESRTRANQIRFMHGQLTLNQWCAMENQNGIGPAGDVRFVPANLLELDAVIAKSKADQQAAIAPPATGVEADGDTETDLQADAYAAGQITAMTAIAVTVATGQITPESAKAQLRLAFPEADEALIAGIIDSIEVKEPDANTNQTPPQADSENPTAPSEPNDNEAPSAPSESPSSQGQPNPNGLALAGLMADVTQRMLRIEAVEAIRAAKHPAKFCNWIDTFYAKHEAKVASAAEPVCVALGGEINGPLFASAHCARSRGDLLEVAGSVTPAKLEQAVQAWADRLSSRWQVEAYDGRKHY